MEIIQPNIEKKEEIKEQPKVTQERKSLKEQVDELKNFKDKLTSGRDRKINLRLSSKAKVRGSRLKKGYVGVLKIDENRNITGEKVRIEGSAFNTKEGTYHATDGREIFFFEGRYPVIIQPSWKKNPLSIDPKSEVNETYGQKYMMAKMLQDTIKVKKKSGNIIIWIIIGVAVLVGINYLTGGGMF